MLFAIINVVTIEDNENNDFCILLEEYLYQFAANLLEIFTST